MTGPEHYGVESLVFDQLRRNTPQPLFQSLFKPEVDFWGTQEELAKKLAQSGLADHFSKPVNGPYQRAHFLRLTPLGRRLFDLAYAQSEASQAAIDGLTIDDALLVLKDEEQATALSEEIATLGDELNKLQLSNFQRATVDSYVSMLVLVCQMPDPDAKLFWIILNRLNQFAGVASLIVALIALKLGRLI